ncbi:hypothetical protein Tco_0514738 [Tanacetum coccineum]
MSRPLLPILVMPSSDTPVYSSGESIESSIPLVILPNTKTEMTVVPTDIPTVNLEISLEVEVTVVASPAGVLDTTNTICKHI